MTDVTYGEHMRWCKDRALAYLDRGDLVNALASMISDLRKRPGTANPTRHRPPPPQPGRRRPLA